MSGPASRPRSSLFAKYFRTLFVAVAAPLIIATVGFRISEMSR